MTPAEAATKWCPMVRMTIVGEALGNVAVTATDRRTAQPMGHCIAEGCMMWRWRHRPYTTGQPQGATARPEGEGHCGLAGTHGAF